jgi:hypothetical protein
MSCFWLIRGLKRIRIRARKKENRSYLRHKEQSITFNIKFQNISGITDLFIIHLKNTYI